MSRPIALTVETLGKILSIKTGHLGVEMPCGMVRVEISPECIRMGSHELERSELLTARSPDALYAPIGRRLEKLQFFRDAFYKLVPTGGYPALEINGIRMHRTKGLLPEEEASLKVDCLSVRRGHKVLDICTGLGYSAQEAARRGAKVVTLEKDAAVLEMASRNPCSVEFFAMVGAGEIGVILCDACRLVEILPEDSFDRVIHDPPTFSLAGELYSSRFYRQIRRIVKEGGTVLHYTGQPGSKYRRRNLKRSVSRRLREAGFETRWAEMARSVLATTGR